MIHLHDVKAKIAAVLGHEMSIEDFARWIMANSWNMHRDSSEAAVELVSSIHLLLAERVDADDDEFYRELSELLDGPNVVRISVQIDLENVSAIRLAVAPESSASLSRFWTPELWIPELA